jgi:hypothetical protein
MSSRRFTVTATTIADGSGTAYSPYLSGKVAAIYYTLVDFAAGVDFTITSEATGETLWTEANVNASTVRRPRGATHTTAGVANLYAAGGTEVGDLIRLSRDRIKIVIAQGGNVKTGTFKIVIED